MESPIKVDSEIMHDTPCFDGTRVPVKTLFNYVEGNYSLDEFFLDFPSVKREQVVAVLDLQARSDKR
jgi:uncharacterized protein (DUF433 family)